jgi:dipeptide/tripeptide permease
MRTAGPATRIIGQGFGPMLAGLIASIWNFEVMFTACAVVYFVALLIYCISLSVNGQEMRHNRHKMESQSETRNTRPGYGKFSGKM